MLCPHLWSLVLLSQYKEAADLLAVEFAGRHQGEAASHPMLAFLGWGWLITYLLGKGGGGAWLNNGWPCCSRPLCSLGSWFWRSLGGGFGSLQLPPIWQQFTVEVSWSGGQQLCGAAGLSERRWQRLAVVLRTREHLRLGEKLGLCTARPTSSPFLKGAGGMGGWVPPRHYLDDFLLVSPGDTPVCVEHLQAFQALAAKKGVLLAAEKTEGPATWLTFLGIQLEMVQGTSSLPLEQLGVLRELLGDTLVKKKMYPPADPVTPGTSQFCLSSCLARSGFLHKAGMNQIRSHITLQGIHQDLEV